MNLGEAITSLYHAMPLLKTKSGELMDLGELEKDVIRYYVAQSWVYDLFPMIAILRALAPMRSGKSRLCMLLLKPIAYKSFQVTGSQTEAMMTRAIMDSHKQGLRTLICDDVAFDCVPGSKRADTFINRCVRWGKAGYNEPDGSGGWNRREQEIFGPTILGGRSAFADVAVESRCLDIDMANQERTERTLPDNWSGQEVTIIRHLESFRDAAVGNLNPEKPVKPGDIDDRLWDIGWPLVYLATLIGDTLAAENLIDYLAKMSEDLRGNRAEEPTALVLAAIVAVAAKQSDGGLPSNPNPIGYKEIREHVWDAKRVNVTDSQISKALKQLGFRRPQDIYISGGYTKLRNIDWGKLKKIAARLDVHDELLEAFGENC